MTSPGDERPDSQPGTLAERQLANARRDPRLDRGPEAVIADWWVALEAAERTRTVAILAISRVAQGDVSAQAAELTELARAEVANEFAEFNAQALVAILSALDALAETLVPRAREMTVSFIVEEGMRRATEAVPEVPEEMLSNVREAAIEVASDVLEEGLGKIKRAGGVGAKRWEQVLRASSLETPHGREIPEDLNEALEEVVSLRHVLVHRAGRVDEKSLTDAPSLQYEVGELVRITRADYQRYSAAVRTYGQEIVWRFARSIGLEPFDLARWRDNYLLGA